MPCIHAKWPNFAGRDLKVSEETKRKLTSQHSELVFRNIGVWIQCNCSDECLANLFVLSLISTYLPDFFFHLLLICLSFCCNKATSTHDDSFIRVPWQRVCACVGANKFGLTYSYGSLRLEDLF